VLATYLIALNWRCRATSFTVFWATALPQTPSWISDGRFAAGKTKEGIGKGLGMEGDIRKEENGVGMKGKLIYATAAAIWIAIKLRRDAHYDHPITATLYVRQQSTHWRQQRLFRLIVLLAAPCTSSTTSAIRESWATLWWKLHDPIFNRLWLIHPCDRRTDRRTDGRHDDANSPVHRQRVVAACTRSTCDSIATCLTYISTVSNENSTAGTTS